MKTNICHKFGLWLTLLFVLLLGLKSSSYALIEVSYANFGYVIGAKGEPAIGCEIWATQNGVPLVLTLENTKLVQSKVALITNLNISAPAPNGRQTFTWGLKIGLPHNIEFEAIVANGQEIGSAILPDLPEFDGYNLACYSVDDYGSRHMIHRVNFTDNNHQYAYLMLAGDAITSSPISTQPFVDSITCTNPNITHNCWPYPPAVMPPPTAMWYGILYRIEATYNEPAGDPYMRDFFIVHMAGGVKYRIEIVAHEPKIENKPLLELLNPQGGEYFSPCEEVLIQWQGHNPSYPTSIAFSADGEKWTLLRNIPGDSASYLWKVPDSISNYCFIRVSQQQYSPERKRLQHDSATIRSAVFSEINSDIASKILTASSANNIVEWDISSTPVRKLTAINTGDSTTITCAIYIDKTRIVAMDIRNNALLYCNTGDNAIQKTVAIPPQTSFRPYAMQCDNLQRFILIQPEKEYGNSLMFIDTAGNYITKLTEDLPFTAIYLTEDKLYYALIDNTIKSVSLAGFPAFGPAEQFDFAKDYNIINTLAVSQDDYMIAVSCRQQIPKDIITTQAQQGDNLIFDKRLGTIFRNLKANTHTNFMLEFSPAGTIAVAASANSPQIMFTDLTNNSETQWQNNPIPFLQGVTMSRTGNALIAYSAGSYNTTYIPFALPEWQMNETPFHIVAPQLSLAAEGADTLESLLIGTADTVTLPLQLCNTGLSKIEITRTQFENINHLELDNSQMSYPIVLQPGECTTLYIIAHPRDTGLLSADLVFTDTCEFNINIPFYIRGIDRKLPFFADTIDFGTNCINDTITLADIALFRNDDTVEVLIMDIVSYNPRFTVTGYSKNTVLQPGESFIATLIFLPGQATGDYNGDYVIYYAGQWAVARHLPAKARTVGIDWAVSHSTLAFVAEVPSRTFTFRNTGSTEVTINSIDILPPGLYSTDFAGPTVVLPGDSLQITVTCHSFPAQDADLVFNTAPCLSGNSVVKLTAYSGEAYVWIPALQADPKNGDFRIPVYFNQQEGLQSGGQRVFEATIELRASLFYPRSVTSSYGTAELVANQVALGVRRIHFRVTGDFGSVTDPVLGTDSVLAYINGTVLLGDTTYTAITWGAESPYFGANVQSSSAPGSLELVDLCEDRFAGTSFNTTYLAGLTVSPQPASDALTLCYEIATNSAPVGETVAFTVDDGDARAVLRLYDLAGSLVLEEEIFLGVGRHSKMLNIRELSAGSYILSVSYRGQQKSLPVIKY